MPAPVLNQLGRDVKYVNPDGSFTPEFIRQWNRQKASNTDFDAVLETLQAQVATLAAEKVIGVNPLTGGGVLGAGKDVEIGMMIVDPAYAPGPWGDATHVPQFTLDAHGRVIAAASVAISSGVIRSGLMTRSTSQSVGASTDVIIIFDTEVYDDANFIDIATQPTRVTVPAGVTRVRVTVGMAWTGPSANEHYLNIKKNGSFAYAGQGTVSQGSMVSGALRMQAVTADLAVTAGDYFEADVFRTAGAGDVDIGAWMSIVALA